MRLHARIVILEASSGAPMGRHAMEDMDVIETPEYVELRRPLAGIGSRFIAGLIDHALLLLGFLVLLLLLMLVGMLSFSNVGRATPSLRWWAIAVLIVAAFVLYWGYFGVFELLMNGQTPGKRRMRIRVAREGGGAAGASEIAIRNLLRPVDALAAYGVAGICMFLTRRVQRLGDLAAGTVVVSEQVADYSAKSDKRRKVEWQDEADAHALRATGLRPEEHRALSSYWARRTELTVDARERILPRIMAPILERAGDDPESRSLDVLEEYVEALLRKAISEGATAEHAAEDKP